MCRSGSGTRQPYCGAYACTSNARRGALRCVIRVPDLLCTPGRRCHSSSGSAPTRTSPPPARAFRLPRRLPASDTPLCQPGPARCISCVINSRVRMTRSASVVKTVVWHLSVLYPRRSRLHLCGHAVRLPCVAWVPTVHHARAHLADDDRKLLTGSAAVVAVPLQDCAGSALHLWTLHEPVFPLHSASSALGSAVFPTRTTERRRGRRPASTTPC